jgi:uncharacterized integral membrane protein
MQQDPNDPAEPSPRTPPPPPPVSPTPGRAPGSPASEHPPRSDTTLPADLDVVQRGRPERAFNVGVTVGVVATVAAVIFMIQNGQSTQFDWLWFNFDLPLWTVLIGGIAIGVALLAAVLLVHWYRQRRIDRRQQAGGRLRRALTPNRQRPARRRTHLGRASGGHT